MQAGSPRFHRYLISLVLLLTSLLGACTSPRVREMWKNEYLQGNFSKSFSVSLRSTLPNEGSTEIVITESALRARIVGSHTSGTCRISYPRGYSSQARSLAKMVNRGLRATEADIGVKIPFTVHFILMPQKEAPSSIAVDYRCDVNEAVFPLFFTEDNQSPKAILSNLLVGIDAFFHEIYEFLLVVPQYSPTVLPDAEGQVYGLRYRSKNYTRWFRDGFATYAAYVTIENIWRQSPHGWPAGKSATSLVSFHHPLSSLDRVRDDLLSWDQYDGQSKNDEYYNASFGVFLAMEHQWKRSTIKILMKEIGKLDYPDGEALLQTFNKTLGVDFGDWLSDFRLKEPPVECSAMDENAGIKITGVRGKQDSTGTRTAAPEDVVVKIGDTRIGNRLDFEIALLRTPPTKISTTPVHILEQGTGRRKQVIFPPSR